MGFQREWAGTDRHRRNPFQPADYGPAERWQHSGRVLELTDCAGVVAARALEENVLDVLIIRRWITLPQCEAALRFKLDYHVAGLEAHLTRNYNPLRVDFSPFGPWDERSEKEEAAYQRWRSALRAVGKINSDIVVTVVCHNIMPAPKNAAQLKAGLDKLADWYGMRKSGKDIDETAAR